jgi:hypothetical protein
MAPQKLTKTDSTVSIPPRERHLAQAKAKRRKTREKAKKTLDNSHKSRQKAVALQKARKALVTAADPAPSTSWRTRGLEYAYYANQAPRRVVRRAPVNTKSFPVARLEGQEGIVWRLGP